MRNIAKFTFWFEKHEITYIGQTRKGKLFLTMKRDLMPKCFYTRN